MCCCPALSSGAYARPGLITGLYIIAIMCGGAAASAFTVPLRDALGGWGAALLIWAVPAALAIALWSPAVRDGARRTPAPVAPFRIGRDREAWLLSGLFACQTVLGYAIVAWVPEILRDGGLSGGRAGVMASLFFLLAIPTAVLTPSLTVKRAWPRRLVLLTLLPWAAGLAGLLAAPAHGTAVWMGLLGLGQGVGFALPLTLVVVYSRDHAHAASLSGMVQGIGYTVGAVSPPLFGVLHDATGAWSLSLAVLLVLAGVQVVLGLAVLRTHDRGRRAAVGSLGSSDSQL